MNKKFSTLVAGVLLATSVGNLYAADEPSYVKFENASTNFSAKINSGTYYQLTSENDGTKVIAMVPTADKKGYELASISSSDATKTELRYTLWTIEVQGNETDGYRYVFMNLATGLPLSVNSQDAVKTVADATEASTGIGGEIMLWKWQDAYNPIGGFKSDGQKELTSVFGAKNDSVMTLMGGKDAAIYALKYALNNKTAAGSFDQQIKVVPVDPVAVLLKADDLNSMLWNQTPSNGKLNLAFDKDVKNNEYANVFAQPLKVVAAQGYPSKVFDWKNPAKETSDGSHITANNGRYQKLFTYENTQFKVDFAKAIKGLLGDEDANKEAVKTFLNTAKGAFVTDYEIGLAAVEKLSTANDDKDIAALNAKVKAAVIAFIKNEKAEISYKTVGDAVAPGVAAVNNVIDAVADKTTAEIDTYITGLKLDEAKKAAEAEKKTNDEELANQGWVSLMTDKENYVMVDTTYMTKYAGNTYLKIIDTAKPAAGGMLYSSDGAPKGVSNWLRQDINGRLNFQFVWYPAQDSIVIRSAGFATLDDQANTETTSNFSDMILDDTFLPAATNQDGKKDGVERNLIKIEVLGNGSHRELSIGNSEYNSQMSPKQTINTRIFISGSSQYEKTTLPEGVYFFNLSSNVKKVQNGKYLVAPFCGTDEAEYVAEEQAQLYGQAQDFGHMPRTQWVVEQNHGLAGQQTVNIYNREFPDVYYAKNVQLYKGGDNAVFALYSILNMPAAGDTLSYVKAAVAKPKAGILTNKYLGYASVTEDALSKIAFNMDYFNGIQVGNFVNVNTTAVDTTVYVDLKGEKVTVELDTVKPLYDVKYGYVGSVAPQLYKKAYRIRVYDSSKLGNNNKFVVEDPNNENTYAISADKSKAAEFYLKENNQLISEEGDTTCYYALISANKKEDPTRVGVRDASMKFSIEGQCSEERVATFALKESTTPLYRRLGVSNPEDGLKDMDVNKYAKIYRVNSTAKEYLYEDAYSVYSKEKGINFLGVEGKGDNKLSALYVDTAYVRNETKMPQYMFAVDVTEVPAGMLCPDNPEHNTDEYIANHGDCGHKVPSQGYKIGRYLVNAQDSVQLAANGKDYIWNEKYTRLSFTWAKHIGDTLIVMRHGKDMNLAEYAVASDSIFLGDNKHNMTTWTLDADPSKNTKGDSINAAHEYGIKNAVFALRLVDDKPACDFLIESVGDKPIPTDGKGGWIKIQNGVPVIAKAANYNEAILDTEIFNIEPTEEVATSNDAITASEVSVVAGNGKVTIKGAAGKTVTISNILGQAIANTVLSSDNAEIAAPQGVVVVAVEGEAAVKAIVK